MANAAETRTWTCPRCGSTWDVLRAEPDIPLDPERCPSCGKPPAAFEPGQLVRVLHQGASRARLGVIHEPVRAVRPASPEDHTLVDDGPYTGEYMVWHLGQGYGSENPTDPEFERAVFSALPTQAKRRHALASVLFVGISALPDQIHRLTPSEEQALLGE